MASYQYKSLPHDRSTIRLLRLQPNGDSKSIIECEIFHGNINDIDQTSYEALSYTWGDCSQTMDIRLNGSTFPATLNLDAALRALRKSDASRVLWVDAICINQADTQEQGEQVRIMWDIYKAADCVVVWLGPEEGDSPIAMENAARQETTTRLAARKIKVEEPADYESYDWCGCHVGDFKTHPPRVGVMNLLGRRWFTRVWVLQEVAAAKQVVVVCGDKAVSGGDFYREIIGVALFNNSFRKILRRVRPALELMNQSTTNRSLPLLELIESFRTWEATKPIDKVYALIGVSSDASGAPGLQPDYNITQTVLAQKLVQFSFPDSVIILQSTNKDEVVFEIEGLLLGEIGVKMVSEQRRWSFDAGKSQLPNAVFNPVASQLFQKSWEIRTVNERRLELGSSVVLLRRASRPTVLRFHESQYIVDMLATPEPIQRDPQFSEVVQQAWPAALEALSAESEGMMKFKLSWDPFRQPYPSEISRYTPTPNDTATQWEAMIESLKDASETNDEENHNCKTIATLRILFEEDEDEIKAGTSEYITTIHKAAFFGYLGTVKLLLDANTDVDSRDSKSNVTALYIAATEGHTKVVRALLDGNATVDSEDQSRPDLLCLVARKGYSEICQMLLDAGANPNSGTGNYSEPLFMSIVKKDANIAKMLLKAGADANAVKTLGPLGGVASLHLAAELGHEEAVTALLAAGAQVGPRTTTDTTPLHQAAMNGHTGIVELLLDAGANIDAQDDNGVTPLDFAVYRDQQETAEKIWQRGGKQHVTARDEDEEESCLDVCSSDGHA